MLCSYISSVHVRYSRTDVISCEDMVSHVLQILKDMLKENNLTANVQVVVADNDWNPAVDVLDDPQFATAVDAIGLVKKQA